MAWALFALLLVAAGALVMPLQRHSTARNPSRDRLGLRDVPQLLTGNTDVLHVYVASVQLGSQWFSLQIDTGSSGTHVPIEGCREDGRPCVSPNPPFELRDRSCEGCTGNCALAGRCGRYDAFPDTTCCGTTFTYGDGSFVSGPLVVAPLTFSHFTLDNFRFLGASTRGRFASDMLDGILGMAWHSLDTSSGDDFIARFADTAGMQPMFSVCLSEQGGALVVSDKLPELMQFAQQPASAPVFFPVSNVGFYSLRMREMSIEGYASPITDPSYWLGQQTIIDTGATFMNLPSDVFNALRSTMMTHFAGVRGVTGPNSLWETNSCVPSTSLDVQRLPNFTFTFDTGAKLQLSPAHYLFRVATNPGSCLHLAIGVLSRDIGIILGDSFMRAFVTVFDRVNTRVGFAPVGDACGPTADMHQSPYRMHNVSVLNGSYRVGDWIEAVVSVKTTVTAGDAAPRPAGVRTFWSKDASHAHLLMSSMVPTEDDGTATQRVFVEAAPDRMPISLFVLLPSSGQRIEFVYAFDPTPRPLAARDLAVYVAIPGFCALFAALITLCAYRQYRKDHSTKYEPVPVDEPPASADVFA